MDLAKPTSTSLDLSKVSEDFNVRRSQYQHMCPRPQYSWMKCYPNIHAALQLISHPRLPTVLELGCHQGDLAVQCLRNLPEWYEWHGYDIAESPVMKRHPRYKFHHIKTQIWNCETVAFDIFVSSHTIEHLFSSEVEKLIQWLNGKCKHAVLCIPLRRTMGDLKGWHVLDRGYEWVTQKLLENKFKQVWSCGGWFGWFTNSQ